MAMPRGMLLCVWMCEWLMVAPALAAPAHEHGVAQVEVSLEGHTLRVALDSPLDNLLGFEHVPATAAQRAAVVAMAHRLRGPGNVLVPDAAARCTLAETHLASSVLAPETLGEAQAAPGVRHQEPAGHADLDADWRFECAHPEALSELRMAFFTVFAGFRLIRVQAVGPRGQAYAELTPNSPVLVWKPGHD